MRCTITRKHRVQTNAVDSFLVGATNRRLIMLLLIPTVVIRPFALIIVRTLLTSTLLLRLSATAQRSGARAPSKLLRPWVAAESSVDIPTKNEESPHAQNSSACFV